ncbi:MAG: preprotein translocase subunit TatC, partial [Cenarchaeum sp. SB0678_bin_8]|nr:preprotein translocase subunit TatC [Cenarchaeum sp. SB0678_bin_8]
MSGLDGISDHLEELRKRVIRISISVMAVTIFAMTFHIEPGVLWGLPVYYPLPEPMNNLAAQITNFMSTQLVPPGVELIQTAPGQAFFSQVYIA